MPIHAHAATLRTLAQTVTISAASALCLSAGPAQPVSTPVTPTSAGEVANLNLAEPLPTDPRLVTGTLENGMGYIVLKHSNPPGRANMIIHVSTGSLNEKDNQRGIAHFLEHMAFNGSENFPPGSVVDFFQSMGLTFGQHQNAFTSFDQTAYILSFPDAKPETLEKGMKFFGDVSSRLLLTQDEIDKERQIILEEKRSRLGAQMRVFEYSIAKLFPDSLIAKRLPIGTEETLLSMNRADFLDYYTRWYTPSNMTVIVVADAPTEPIVEQIKRSFSAGKLTARPVDIDSSTKPNTSTYAIVASDPELTSAEVSIVSTSPRELPVRTLGDFRARTVRDLALGAFNRRIGDKLSKGGSSMTSGEASVRDLFRQITLRSVVAGGEPAKWKDMLSEIAAELRRATLHGFTQRELDDMKSQMLSDAERSVEQEATIPARQVIMGINGLVASGDAITSASQDVELLRRVLPTISRADISKAFADAFAVQHVVFEVDLPSNVAGGLPSESEVVELGKKALSVEPLAEVESHRPTNFLSAAPPAGKVAQSEEHAASNVSTFWLDNGVCVHHRMMDIRKDTVWVSVTLAGGQILEDASNRGVSEAAVLAWQEPATAALSSKDVRDLLIGKKVQLTARETLDTLSMVIEGNPQDLEAGVQLAHLLLTSPKIEASAFDRWKVESLQEIEKRRSVPQAAMPEALVKAMFPASDLRTQLLTKDQVQKLTLPAAQAWLDQTLKAAPIEVAIVGDLSKERAVQLASTYFGSLPKRDRISAATLDDKRTLERSPGPRQSVVELDTPTPVAIVMSGFYGPDAENLPDTRTMQLATRVLATRVLKKIREEEQLGYSPSVRVQPGDAFPGFGIVMMASPTEPAKVERLLAATTEIFDAFAKGGPTSEEMEVAKKQIANQVDETMKQPEYWLDRAGSLNYRNLKLDDLMGSIAFYQSLTPEDVTRVFTKYYTKDNALRVIVKPMKGSSEGGPKK